MMEADTCHEWDEAVVGRWLHCDSAATALSLRPPATALGTDKASVTDQSSSVSGHSSKPDEFRAILAIEATSTVEALSASDLERHAQFLDANPGRIHSDIDRPTLASLRNRLGRDLTDTERKEYRQAFAAALRSAYTGTA